MTRRARLATEIVATTFLLAFVQDAVPWPGGARPSPTFVAQELHDAEVRHTLEESEAFGSAKENEKEPAVAQLMVDEVDHDTLFTYGRRFFALPFRPAMGRGGLVRSRGVSRVHRGVAGALDATGCDGCHSQGGRDGSGTFAESALMLGDGEHLGSTTRRNPPALLGLGLVQALAVEMTAELQGEVAEAEARLGKEPITVPLTTHGVSFGQVVVRPDGTRDTAGIAGIDPDLVVKPFGWKGTQARVRRMVEEAARLHFGMQTVASGLHPDTARLGDGPPDDPDGDGTIREIEDDALTAVAVYFELLETPAIVPPADTALQARWASGKARFAAVGCDGCHVPSLRLEDRTWSEVPDLPGSPPVTVQLLRDGETPRGTDDVMLFSDLKRHDLGPGLAEPVADPSGVPRSVFLTRPLWGVAETGPWLHDGRATTLPAAIAAHGGEATAARDAWLALPPEGRQDVEIFLLSLSRTGGLRVAR